MADGQTLLLIADIGGYTQYMKMHRGALAHAQFAVAGLLEAVIDAAQPAFEVAKLEGDAVFLYAKAPGGRGLDQLAGRVGAMRRSFGLRQQGLEVDRVCNCQGCTGAADLKLKFVSHVGEVAFQKVKRFHELAGFDVIVVHRLLKNTVPLSEYVLMTEAVARHLAPDLAAKAQALVEDFEGVGPTELRYLDLAQVADLALPAPVPSLWRKAATLGRNVVRTLPYLVGLKRPAVGFHNLGPGLDSAGTA